MISQRFTILWTRLTVQFCAYDNKKGFLCQDLFRTGCLGIGFVTIPKQRLSSLLASINYDTSKYSASYPPFSWERVCPYWGTFLIYVNLIKSLFLYKRLIYFNFAFNFESFNPSLKFSSYNLYLENYWTNWVEICCSI